MQFAKAVFKQTDAKVRYIDETARVIWHKITSETRDRLGDIVRIDGIDTKDFQKKPAVLYGHDYRSMNPIPVIAKNVGFQASGKDLYAGTRFLNPKEVSAKLADLVNDCWVLNKEKLLGWSVGFIPHGQKDIIEGGKVTGQDYTKSELLEYSNVIIPAHQDAVNDAISRGLVSKSIMNLVAQPQGPGAAGEVYFYKWVGESEVAGDKVRAALLMVEFCQRKLKIQALDLTWFRYCDPREPGALIGGPRVKKAFVMLGAGSPAVHLRADLSTFDIQFAAAHECHHVWMELQPAGHHASLNAEDREHCADAFAFLMTKELRDALECGWQGVYSIRAQEN